MLFYAPAEIEGINPAVVGNRPRFSKSRDYLRGAQFEFHESVVDLARGGVECRPGRVELRIETLRGPFQTVDQRLGACGYREQDRCRDVPTRLLLLNMGASLPLRSFEFAGVTWIQFPRVPTMFLKNVRHLKELGQRV